MPPTTRSSQHMPPRPFLSDALQFDSATPAEDELESEEHFDADNEALEYEEDEEMDDDDDDDENPGSPSAFYSGTARQLLEPLQQTADRVSRQVEEFARCLDKFNTARELSDQALWDDAWSLLEQYNATALKRMQRIGSGSSSPRSTSRNRRSLRGNDDERQKVQFEADLWALAHDMLLTSSPTAIEDAQANQETALERLHRYSSNAEIWSAFLESDLTAQESEAVLAWLQDRALAWSPPIEEVIAPLLAKADRGEGVWSSTAIYTQNAIKAQKRSRLWPQPLDPSNPGIKSSHKRADGKSLITQLDPDARTRESAVLQPQDDFHEQAAWQACWEYLRRGASQQELEAYWSQRKEVWRLAVLRANDAFMAKGTDFDKSPWLRIMNIATNLDWFECCQYLCQEGENNYDFQSAVYAILCGEITAPFKVCKSTDDHLFTLFNSILVSRFKAFADAYRVKLEHPTTVAYTPPPSNLDQVRKYLILSQTEQTSKEESHGLLKSIEAALVSKDYNSFFLQLGRAAAQVAHTSGESAHLIEAVPNSPQIDIAQIAARDPDSIRIVAHLQLLYKSLGYLSEAYENQLYTIENNIVSYIGWLQRDGKFNLIPLYASKLSADRIPFVLGAILIDVSEQKERDLQVRLMKQYQLDVPNVLWGLFSLANRVEVAKFKQGMKMTEPNVTELVGAGKFKNVKIRTAFMGPEIGEQEEIAIRSAEWFRYIDAENWGKACYSITTLYKIFLYQGKLSAARDLAIRASLTDISLAALGLNAHFADVLSPDDENGRVELDGMSQEESSKSISPSKKRKEHPLARPGTTREVAASQALVWGQLEQLVMALEALDRWSELADEVDRNRNNTAVVRGMKKALRDALTYVQDAMHPLLDKDFLCTPLDEAEAGVLRKIRTQYLPECIIAYNAVLFFAGHAISRQWLVECMNLAQLVATNETLTNAFVEARRMREFVDAIAWSAQGMVEASELGRRGKGSRASSKGERDRDAELGLWNISWESVDAQDLEALD